VPVDGFPLSAHLLRQYVQARLPSYMVPSTIEVLREWPLTPTGKVDRPSLSRREPGIEPEVEWRAPLTPDEDALCAIFSEVLGRGRVGRDDDFFDLGGHSLLAIRLVNRIRARMGVECAVSSVFDSPSAASLAARLRQGDAGACLASLPTD
jgi:Phosphopantetheine attachment site